MALPKFTIGIEEEYQIIHPETRELTSYVQEFLDQGRIVLKDQIKPEFLQSQVEVGSRICHNDRRGPRRDRPAADGDVCELAESNGLRVGGGRHAPVLHLDRPAGHAGERYTKHERSHGRRRAADARLRHARPHRHRGPRAADRRDEPVALLPAAPAGAVDQLAVLARARHRAASPTARSSSSNLPRAGLPPSFESWAEYQSFVDTLIKTGCIDEPTKIWWDIRPNPKYPTLEFRFADICTRVDEAICIAALVLGIVAKLIQLRADNISWRATGAT